MDAQDNLVSYIEQSIKQNWELLALTDFKGQSFQYRDVARKIAKLHLLFENADLKPGDRVVTSDMKEFKERDNLKIK